MQDMLSVNIEGLEELQESFEKIIRSYPDKGAELLRDQARELRKDVLKKVRNDMDYNPEGKRSLSKASSYEISEVQGYGQRQYVEVSAKAPHFHLLENGHQVVLPRTRTITDKNGEKRKVVLKNGGANRGYVPGYKMMDRSTREREREMPEAVKKLVDTMFDEGGFE